MTDAQNPPAAGRYMLRIKLVAGRVSADQLDHIANLSRRFGCNLADITTRQNIQLHWLRIADLPAILHVVEKQMGITQAFSAGDTPRAVTGCPLAGITTDEHLDTSGLAEAVSSMWHHERRAFSNLPRKFKTAAGGCRRHCHLPQINDIGFFGVTRKDGSAGLGLVVGGGLRNTPHLAQSLRVFVPPRPALVAAGARMIKGLETTPLLDEPLFISMTGCPNACAHYWRELVTAKIPVSLWPIVEIGGRRRCKRDSGDLLLADDTAVACAAVASSAKARPST